MAEVVEHAGKPFRAAAVRAAVYWHGDRAGRARVGPEVVSWEYRRPDAVAVSHRVPLSGLAFRMGAEHRDEAYPLRVLRDATPTGGARWWWQCPGCERRCGLLYLVPGRPRLVCRLCHGLTYLCRLRRRRTRR